MLDTVGVEHAEGPRRTADGAVPMPPPMPRPRSAEQAMSA
jgi:hypothetical protein